MTATPRLFRVPITENSRSVSASLREEIGFVHDDERRVDGKRFRDLHKLPLRDGQIAHKPAQIDVQPYFRNSCTAAFLEALREDPPEPGGRTADEEVLNDVQRGQHGKLLVDDGYARGNGLPRRGKRHVVIFMRVNSPAPFQPITA